MELPHALRRALDAELEGVPLGALAGTVDSIREGYRSREAKLGSSFVSGDESTVAYAAYRMPSTFAAAAAVFEELRARDASFRPESLLDVGAGPGTASWAATELFDSLKRVTLFEREGAMSRLGKRLAEAGSNETLHAAEWVSGDATDGELPPGPFDLVVAAYMLGELPAPERARLVSRLWAITSGVLVLLEPAKSPQGFRVVIEARDGLIAAGGRVLAPCPHDLACPLDDRVSRNEESGWCHFARRVSRTSAQRYLKGGTRSFEDEKFSYVAAARRPVPGVRATLVAPPARKKGMVRMKLCVKPSGVEHAVVTKGKDPGLYKVARDLEWGNAIPGGSGEER